VKGVVVREKVPQITKGTTEKDVNMTQNYDIEYVRRYIENESEESKIFIGCDSEVFKRKGRYLVDYYSVVIVHHNARNGAKIFGFKTTEIDYSKDRRKPLHRLMNEVYKASALYLEIADSIGVRDVEVHLDINSDKRYVSNQIVDQAIGYIKATCNVVPLIKPDSWAATHVADKFIKVARG